jgi:hypothetical protein
LFLDRNIDPCNKLKKHNTLSAPKQAGLWIHLAQELVAEPIRLVVLLNVEYRN